MRTFVIKISTHLHIKCVSMVVAGSRIWTVLNLTVARMVKQITEPSGHSLLSGCLHSMQGFKSGFNKTIIHFELFFMRLSVQYTLIHWIRKIKFVM